MCIPRMVSVCGLAALVVVCTAAPDKARGPATPTLWDADRSILFPALRGFILSPGTKPDRKFMPIEKGKEGELRFKRVPDGWFTWKDDQSAGRVLVLDQDGFRILIRLEQVSDVEKALADHIRNGQGHRSVVMIDQLFPPGGIQVSRVVKCAKGKGETQLVECRYFETKHGAVCVELTVFDWPEKRRTLDHLLAFVRSHYGKYEGVCDQVANIVVEKR